MTGLLGLIGSLYDQAQDDNSSPSYLTRVSQQIHPQDAETGALAQYYAQQAAAKQQEVATNANTTSALQGAVANGVTNPLQLFGAVAQANPEYLKDYASSAASNPLGFALGAGNQGGGQGSAAPLSGLQGNDLIKALPPQIGSTIKAYADGKIPFNARVAATPQGQTLLGLVTQYDPTFDANDYNKRASTVKDFSPGGKSNQNVTKIQTAVNTLLQLKEKSDALGGIDDAGILTKPLNYVDTEIKSAKGSSTLNDYRQLQKAAADETTNAIISAGGTGADRESRHKTLEPTLPPEARSSAIQTAVQELMSRLDPLAESYTSGMGKTVNGVQLLDAKTQKAYAKLMGQAPETTKVDANGPSGAPAPTAPATDTMDAISQAKAAIQGGADRNAVIKRLQDNKIDTTGL